MIVVGLTGSIAMGKSEVAKIFRSEGIPVFDSDAEVHRLYDSAAGAQLLHHEAPDATHGGKVDRKILSDLVLKDPELLAKLEKKVHAEIRSRRAVFLDEQRAAGHALAVIDVPLLFETGEDKNTDFTLVVSSSEKVQRKRALARPGMTEQRFAMILKRQMPDAEKRKRATCVIENNGTLDDLKRDVLAVISKLKDK